MSHYAVAASNDDTSEPRQRVPPRPDPHVRLMCRGLLSMTPRGQPAQPADEAWKSTVMLSCGHYTHRGCWAHYRQQEYDDFMNWAKSQPTDQIWEKYRNGQYFKMLRCPTCLTPVHETYYGKAHSGINEDIGWAVHDQHVYPTSHYHFGDLGTSTNLMSSLAGAILTDQQVRGNLVCKTHDDPSAQNVDDSQRLEQAIVAEEYEHSRRLNANRSSSSTGGLADNFAVLKTAEGEDFNSVRPYTASCHATTRAADGRMALLIVPGSVGNLCGDRWAKELAQLGKKYGQDPKVQTRDQPMKVSGVGSGSQRCVNNYILPVALQSENFGPNIGTVYRTPAVENSDLPGLLGLQAMRDHRVVLDLQKLRMYFVGPGDYDLDKALSPGTVSFALEVAPSGHLLLPCSNFSAMTPNSTKVHHTETSLTTTAIPPTKDDVTAGTTPVSSTKRDI